jgi:hypothetical protein
MSNLLHRNAQLGLCDVRVEAPLGEAPGMDASEGYRIGMTLKDLPADLPPGRLMTPDRAWDGNGP